MSIDRTEPGARTGSRPVNGDGKGDGSASANVRERAIDAYDSARERAAAATSKAGDQIDEAPLIALVGGLAAGALIAALLPRGERETRLLAPVGERITGGARSAIDAAKDAGRDKLAELNLTRDAGASALETLIRGVSEAALGSVRRKG
ncbi:MAG TPA: hypothetical protein VNI79_06020 [Sphingomicrobium sp.]|nr:hypothetical protein [Sphingomicrobium sp.]